MKGKKILKIVMIFLIIIVAQVYFLFFYKKKDNAINMVENFSLYQEITDPAERLLWEGCNANEEFNQFKKIIKQGSMKKLILPGGAQAMVTPNYYNWSNKKFLSFINIEPEAFCGVGGFFPIHAYKNNLLWFQRCSGGAIFDEDNPEYQEFIKCTETEESINNYFK